MQDLVAATASCDSAKFFRSAWALFISPRDVVLGPVPVPGFYFKKTQETGMKTPQLARCFWIFALPIIPWQRTVNSDMSCLAKKSPFFCFFCFFLVLSNVRSRKKESFPKDRHFYPCSPNKCKRTGLAVTVFWKSHKIPKDACLHSFHCTLSDVSLIFPFHRGQSNICLYVLFLLFWSFANLGHKKRNRLQILFLLPLLVKANSR